MKKLISLIVAFVFVLTASSIVDCASTYTAVASVDWNGHSYHLYDEGMTWEEAQEYCENAGGHLVTITSEEEQKIVEQLLENGSKKQYWIGLSKSTGTMQWVTEEALTYTNWDRGEPNSSSAKASQIEQYVHIYNLANPAVWGSQRFKWNDMYNDNTYPGEESFFSLEHIGLICEFEEHPIHNPTTSFGSGVSDWAKEEVEEAYDENLIPDILVGEDLTKKVNRAEFAAIAVALYETLTNTKATAAENPFNDIDANPCEDEILKAYNLDITIGTSQTTFDPELNITREQMATMLTRAYKKAEFAGWSIEKDADYPLNSTDVQKFNDDNEISEYAKESVYFMVRWEIIKGVGENRFAPKNSATYDEAYGYATREQAVIIALRSAKHLQ